MKHDALLSSQQGGDLASISSEEQDIFRLFEPAPRRHWNRFSSTGRKKRRTLPKPFGFDKIYFAGNRFNVSIRGDAIQQSISILQGHGPV